MRRTETPTGLPLKGQSHSLPFEEEFGRMVPLDSPLRRLPPFNAKDLLLLDGIRHAAEIIGLCDSRLRATLAELSMEDDVVPEGWAMLQASALADAWTIVDSVHRFSGLFRLIPAKTPDATASMEEYKLITQPISKLRNVTDHLPGRLEYLLSRRMPTMGRLSWFTAHSATQGIVSVIVPGSLSTTSASLLNPAGNTFRAPVGLITLEAGEHKACLCDIVMATEKIVRRLEGSILRLREEHRTGDRTVGADLVLHFHISFEEPVQVVAARNAAVSANRE